MDDLAAALEGSFSVSKVANNPAACHPRFSQYKNNGKVSNQQERRQKLLNIQKQRRHDYVNHFRNLADGTVDDEEDNEADDDSMEVTEQIERRPPRSYKNQLMMSEWLVDVPDDMETEWTFVLCPVAKRSLVVSFRGQTKCYSRSGVFISSFPSHLPGGSRATPKKIYSPTILDCLFCSRTQTFYVLDVLCWAGYPLVDCECEFRLYWLAGKFAEIPDIVEKTNRNRYRFVQMEYAECSQAKMEEAMSKPVPFPSGLDGVMFHHKKAIYFHGYTPLVGWLKSYMMPEILNVRVSEAYMESVPQGYQGVKEHLKESLEKAKRRREQEERILTGNPASGDSNTVEVVEEMESVPSTDIESSGILKAATLNIVLESPTQAGVFKGFKKSCVDTTSCDNLKTTVQDVGLPVEME